MIFLNKKMGAIRWYIVYIVEDSTDYTLSISYGIPFLVGEGVGGKSTLLFGLIPF